MRRHFNCFPQFNLHTNIGIIYSKEITTTTITTTTTSTTNNKVNANSDPGPVIQIIEEGRKNKYKLRRQGRYMQNPGPGLVIKL